MCHGATHATGAQSPDNLPTACAGAVSCRAHRALVQHATRRIQGMMTVILLKRQDQNCNCQMVQVKVHLRPAGCINVEQPDSPPEAEAAITTCNLLL
jgi:hypothetical protein